MLANNLTLDDEEAVQEELAALQKEAVRAHFCSFLSCPPMSTDHFGHLYKITQQNPMPEPILKLPDVPQSEPVVPEGEHAASGLDETAVNFSLQTIICSQRYRAARGCLYLHERLQSVMDLL
jgi:hypothetical protein